MRPKTYVTCLAILTSAKKSTRILLHSMRLTRQGSNYDALQLEAARRQT